MNLEGHIDITLKPGVPLQVDIHSTRPQLAQRLLGGRTPGEAADLAGRLFSLCGKAQRAAAEMACSAGAGRMPVVPPAQEREVLLEQALEHVWHLGAQLGNQDGLLRLRRAGADPQRFAEVLDDLLQTALLGEPAGDWLRRDFTGFDAWVMLADTPMARRFAAEVAPPPARELRLLPSLECLSVADVADLARQALDTPDFCARPTLYGEPAQTGALSRVEHPSLASWVALRGTGAAARLLARLLELARLPEKLSGLGGAGISAGPASIRAWPLGNGIGVAGVETARGLLLHVVRLREGCIDQYRIIAPTEWNFHPAGALPLALAALTPGPGLAARAKAICQSLDPCVAYAIEVQDA